MTKTTPELATPSPSFRITPAGGRLATAYDLASTTPAGGRLATAYDLASTRPTYTVDLQWNRVSSLEPSGPGSQELKTRPSQPSLKFRDS
ncbi:hypothetical protein AVEN_125580-1 [Araneus ventricosus]|uniref:Uncharacterized protein n=1 Tax=Araneus ventricosus TaxID=182803 RepID=A0A4Y2N8M0_ARAVE|nr:hypothetical protein AVEN_125580-1 [Araneus ventricosus]